MGAFVFVGMKDFQGAFQSQSCIRRGSHFYEGVMQPEYNLFNSDLPSLVHSNTEIS